MTVVINSFDVFDLLILPFYMSFSFLNCPWSSIFVKLLFLGKQPKQTEVEQRIARILLKYEETVFNSTIKSAGNQFSHGKEVNDFQEDIIINK